MDSVKAAFDFSLPVIDAVPGLRAVIGVALVFFLPGFAWTLVFFSKLTVLERLALSIGLSVALVTLSILALNAAFKVPVSGLNSFLTIILISAVPLAIYFLKKYRGRQAIP